MNEAVAQIMFSGAVGLVVIGIGGMAMSTHLFRMVLALAIAEAGANLLLVMAGYRWDSIAPIFQQDTVPTASMVDPVPQAMVLTAIVIGVGVQALALALVVRVHGAYGTLDMRLVRQRMEQDLARAAGTALPGSMEAPVGERPIPAPGAAPARSKSQ